jgi:hypothetical protein
MMIAAEIRSAALGDAVSMMVDPAMSTSGSGEVVLMTFSTAMPMAVSIAELMSILALVGEGAGESVDPDPVVPTVGAN